MGTFLAVIGITLALAGWKLTGEVASEYFANYVVDQNDLGASTGQPRSIPPAAAPAAATAHGPAPAMPVLLAAVRGGAQIAATPAPADPPAPQPAASESSTQAPATAAPEASAGSEDPLLSLIGDTPHRRPDGTVFLPIAAQHVFGLRTVIGQRVSVPTTVEMPGRVVTNPSTGHLIQPAQEGFVQPVGAGLPFAGQKVRRGELLARLVPALSTVERAQLDIRIQELTNNIDLARRRMARIEEVLLVRYRANRIEQMRVEIDGMRRQLAILRGTVDQPIELRAQTDGILSSVNASAGQFVEAGQTIFEIVDPSRLWVSAAAFEPGIHERLVGASAMTTDGRALALRFVGGGLELRSQALPLNFEIVGPAGNLTVATPVTVVVQVEGPGVTGLRIPREAVTRTSDGRQLVWERRAAESFVAHHVSVVPVDAASVLVTSPIAASARIVTAGVATLGQIQ
ncbi:MAG: efflux RND transporter periplasmic adaptor subunit [Alphaproteobacteria bacterium]